MGTNELTFLPGENETTTTVVASLDDTVEDTESFILRLLSESSVDPNLSVLNIIIMNSDSNGIIVHRDKTRHS